MKILNLGCGNKTCHDPRVVNIDWSIYLKFKTSAWLRPLVPIFFHGERLERFHAIPNNVVAHNLSKGIPFADNSVDMVYHSHMLEHLDREVAESFLLEVKRVLKPDGIHRIVVPDLEIFCRAYLDSLSNSKTDTQMAQHHEHHVTLLLEQSVRREAYGTSQQSPPRRWLENRILGDARRRGETHQWMYDKVNLEQKLIQAGYHSVSLHSHTTSNFDEWNSLGLDLNEHNGQYKPDSLYIEARK